MTQAKQPPDEVKVAAGNCPLCDNAMRQLITSDVVHSEWYCTPCHKSYPMDYLDAEKAIQRAGQPTT